MVELSQGGLGVYTESCSEVDEDDINDACTSGNIPNEFYDSAYSEDTASCRQLAFAPVEDQRMTGNIRKVDIHHDDNWIFDMLGKLNC